MCSCSGSCNCNSTTIPRGPQGVPGPKGDEGDKGDTGSVGPVGNNGINAFTTLTGFFIQPAANSTVQINVANTAWAAEDQIIYVGNSISFPDPGGFYRVTNILTPTSMVVTRMDWTIPGVTFRATTTAVGAAGTIVTPSGTIGASASAGVERIKADIFSNPGPGLNALITVPFNELDAIGKIITFTIESTTGDATGVFNSTGFSINDGLTTTSLFSISSAGPNFGIDPAKIKFDKDPNTPPSGYTSNEVINFIKADVKITRIATNAARIEGTIYGYNKEFQALFGESQFAQKIWRLDSGFNYSTNFTIVSSTSDDGSGGSTGMINILRYNTTL
jgi:hypothetical protein